MKVNYYLNDDINNYYDCFKVQIMVRTRGLCQVGL